MNVTNEFRGVRAKTDEVCILNGKSDKNAGFVSYDLASEVIIPLFFTYGVMWRDYIYVVSTLLRDTLLQCMEASDQEQTNYLTSTSLSILILYKI